MVELLKVPGPTTYLQKSGDFEGYLEDMNMANKTDEEMIENMAMEIRGRNNGLTKLKLAHKLTQKCFGVAEQIMEEDDPDIDKALAMSQQGLDNLATMRGYEVETGAILQSKGTTEYLEAEMVQFKTKIEANIHI